ncbi:DUF6009 family protein [Nostoc sp. LEGE 06077]|uniref:DUF6009 family protein n=1 Tax=Nostoc sp. LEGE 06077 TaxID=915325 RepID=UPI001D14B699|nr:DUF6009 family protein [Nostoc sp. LEGE 06077]
MQKEDSLNYEKEIIWLFDPNDYPWVREGFTDFSTRQGISQSRKREIDEVHKLIGYADLEDNTPPSSRNGDPEYFYRRYFTIGYRDYEAYTNNNCPTEAVDPLTVEPKIKGSSPKRKAQIAVRVPLFILRKLNTHIQKTGMSQTDVVVSALAKYLDSTSDIPLIQRIVALEERVAILEAKG